MFGRVTEFVEPGPSEEARAALRPARHRFPSHLVGAMLIRRTAFERVGRFAEDYAAGVTVEWYSRAVEAGLRSAMLDDAGRQFIPVAREAVERKRASRST